MIYLFISVFDFFITLIIQILIHKLLVRIGKTSSKTIYVFIIGFIVNIFIISSIFFPHGLENWFLMPIKLNAILLYGIVSMIFAIYFASAYYSEMEMSASARIVYLLHLRKKLNVPDLMSYFSNKKFVDDRIEGLMGANLILKKQNRYYVTTGGKGLLTVINLYKRVIKW